MTNPHRLAKNEQLTRLALEVTSGVIVELGAYRGEGTMALLIGAKVPVYAVDNYTQKRGWANEKYEPSDKDIFLKNTKDIPLSLLTLFVGDAEEIAAKWKPLSISLLVWDLGTDRLAADFEAWQDKVIGRWAIHDTDDARFSRNLNPAGWRKYKDGVFWILERTS